MYKHTLQVCEDWQSQGLMAAPPHRGTRMAPGSTKLEHGQDSALWNGELKVNV